MGYDHLTGFWLCEVLLVFAILDLEILQNRGYADIVSDLTSLGANIYWG